MGSTCCKIKNIDEGLSYGDLENFYQDFKHDENQSQNLNKSTIHKESNDIKYDINPAKGGINIKNDKANNESDINKNEKVSTPKKHVAFDFGSITNLPVLDNVKQPYSLNQNEIKLLKLIVRESKSNTIGEEYRINNTGLIGSQRNSSDGTVIFGKSNANNSNVDFVLSNEDSANDKHFEIKYDKVLNTYYIKNQKQSGVFIKVINKVIIKNGMVISFGTNHLQVQIVNKEDNDQKESPSVIKFKTIFGPNKGQE